MTISQPKSNEDEISLYVKAAIEKIDRVEEDAKKEKTQIEADANKKKTQIVQDLAKDLEGKIATDSISNEIVHQLRGKVSETLIRRCLDEKYKEKHRVANARKQKKKRESTDDLAAPHKPAIDFIYDVLNPIEKFEKLVSELVRKELKQKR